MQAPHNCLAMLGFRIITLPLDFSLYHHTPVYIKKTTTTIRTCAPIPPTTIASLHTMVLCALTIPNLGSLTFRFLLFIVSNIKENMPSKQASKTPLFRNKKGQRVGIQIKQLFHSVIIRAPEHFWIANRHFIQQRYS